MLPSSSIIWQTLEVEISFSDGDKEALEFHHQLMLRKGSVNYTCPKNTTMVDSTLTLDKCSKTALVKAFDFVFVFFVFAQFII